MRLNVLLMDWNFFSGGGSSAEDRPSATKQTWYNPEGSHSYVHEVPLGKTVEVGTAKDVMSKVVDNPDRYFPMHGVDGSVKKEGDIAYLRPVPFVQGNPVKVIYKDDTTLLLEACPGHTFQGTAEHSTFEKNGWTYYRVAGAGPQEKESRVMQTINNNFPWATSLWWKGTGNKDK
jgi:hypothetical protein